MVFPTITPPWRAMAKSKQRSDRPDNGIRSWLSRQPTAQRPALKAALISLRQAYRQKETTSIPWWHEVGGQVATFFPEDGRQYGSELAELLACELGAVVETDVKRVSNDLWKARKIARTITCKQAAAWSKKRNAKGRPLSAYHVHSLVGVEDAQQRDALLDQCLTESWSVTRLHAEVQKLSGKKRSRGGRPARKREIPPPVVALQEIQLAAKHWKANHAVWFKAKKAALKKVAKDLQTDELYEELSRAADELIEMQQAVDEGLACIERLAQAMEEQR